MSSSDDSSYYASLFTVSQQKAFIGADLNSTLLQQFMFGMYTAAFAATFYIYLHKENRTASNDIIVLGSLTALYAITALGIGLGWFYTNFLFCTQGGTRIEIFVESQTGSLPTATNILINAAQFLGYLCADSLLVWRCFRACGQSFRIFLLPLLLFIVEITLVMSSLVYTCLVEVKPGFFDSHTAGIDDHLEAAMYISVGATSIVATFIICYQIYMRTALHSPMRKRYRNIIDSLVQSSGTYSAIVVVLGIMQATESGESQTSFKIQLALAYVEAISLMIAGLAPTLMVARLSVTTTTHEDSETLSDSLPSDLVSETSQSTLTNVQRHQGDVEMQQDGSVGRVLA